MKYWQSPDMGNLRGKVAVVTGGNRGLGFAVARALVRQGAHTILGCRDPEAAEDAAASLVRETPDTVLTVLEVDLGDLASVRAAAAHLTTLTPHIDLFINNAGLLRPAAQTSADGFEIHFAVNHLGHFALTQWCQPLLDASEAPRIVSVSSLTHLLARSDWANFDPRAALRPSRAYALSKLANLHFTTAQNMRGTHISAVSAHPGYATSELLREHPRLSSVAPFFGQRSGRAVLSILLAASSDSVPRRRYYGPRFGLRGHPTLRLPAPWAYDREEAERLWTLSESLIQEAA